MPGRKGAGVERRSFFARDFASEEGEEMEFFAMGFVSEEGEEMEFL